MQKSPPSTLAAKAGHDAKPLARLPFARTTLVCSLALVFAACSTTRPYAPPDAMLQKPPLPSQNDMDAAKAGPQPQTVFKGTGVLVRGQLPGGGLPPSQFTQVGGGNVVLNFEGADLREVIRNILGDILNENYVIEGNVGGTVTIRTSTGIAREALLPTLETILRMNGATMIHEGNLFKIIPMQNAVRGNVSPQLGNSQRALPAGFSVQIVPLRYTSAVEMGKILEPFAKDAQAIRVDTTRNLLIMAGTERELRHLMDTVETFDINWMAGMSVGVFTLQNADVKSVMDELDKAIGTNDKTGGPLTGIFKIIPIERLNAIIVVSPNAEYVEEAKKWVDRLDKGGGGDGPRFFVYHLQNTRAEHLGPLLQQAFTGRSTAATGTTGPSVSPGTPSNTIVSPPSFTSQPAVLTPTAPQINVNSQPPSSGPGGSNNPNAPGSGIVRNLQVVADKDNNDILIVATPVEYQIIEAALRKLDVQSRQVVMELAIIEVALNDDLEFGVDWLFRGGAPSGRGSGGNINTTAPVSTTGGSGLTGGPNNGIAANLIQGFTYLISNAAFPGGIQAAVKLLDTYGNTKVVSNPHISALDNQKATIKVGTQIPINQQSIVGSTTNVVTTTSSYIDTGVLVQVTPHINAGGLVTLEVDAEVSDPGSPAAPGDAPPINTRSVQTILSVPSGETMVMGGLIQEHKANSSAGLPLVSRIPILGGLFGQQTLTMDRTELMLFITPRVVENVTDVDTVINDLRRRMDNIDEYFPGGKDAGRYYPAGDSTELPATRPVVAPTPLPGVAPADAASVPAPATKAPKTKGVSPVVQAPAVTTEVTLPATQAPTPVVVVPTPAAQAPVPVVVVPTTPAPVVVTPAPVVVVPAPVPATDTPVTPPEKPAATDPAPPPPQAQ